MTTAAHAGRPGIKLGAVPVERVPISVSQLCELIEVDPSRFRGVEPDQAKREGEPRDSSRLWIVLEAQDGAE